MQPKAFCAFAFVIGVSSCGGPGPGGVAVTLSSAAVAGCYRFSWQRSDSLLQDGLFYPDLVRLDNQRACPECDADSRGAKYLSLASPLPDTVPYVPGKPIPWHRLYYASWWQIAPPDTLVIVFNANVEWWNVRLTPANGALSGRAEFGSDGGILPPANVTAVRTSCAIAA